MLYLFEMSKKWAFSDMYGLGGGVGDHIFFGNQGRSRTLPGFWAVCEEYTGGEPAGFFRSRLIFGKRLFCRRGYVIPS